MIDHEHDLTLLQDATGRLLASSARLDNAGTAAPSRLPGWTRGHVLAHLARNAEALLNVFEGRPMYASDEQRDTDIERDASRGISEQLADLRETHDRFRAAAAADQDWSRTVTLRNGVTDSIARVPFRRLVEIELHHVDLGVGYELEDLPEEFTGREIALLTERFDGHPQVPPTVVAVPDGREWRTGGGEGDPVTVTGEAADLLGWLCGRRAGTALKVTGGPLPVLPPL